MSRFARYWDLIGNPVRFSRTTPLLLGEAPFRRFLQFSDWFYADAGRTHEIALDRLFDAVFRALTELFGEPWGLAVETLRQDYARTGLKRVPEFLGGRMVKTQSAGAASESMRKAIRQIRHARQGTQPGRAEDEGSR